ncbi:MAG TPA: sulfotransferase family 2 domain-containing protein [Ideonella sp.]|uniref:sulfotransferase family 2 domain-containing protein n=1 Tax=Ideonella sp. TaxID=1929293 RepID=UPI002E316AFC|nr:sulfotransferase family 2 domain-containing protein [Ideonella sp.]HEX5684138.1 sulfotransferase family 2 domain-containing protein [Ideonella sp.]
MLSIERQFLFLHIPKTGGNSIQDLLRPLSDDRLVCLAPHQDGIERFELRSNRYRTQKHSTLAEYHREYGAELFDSLFRFTCTRNPWDRVVSFYFSPHRGRVQWTREDFLRFIPTVPATREYLALPGDAAPTLAVAARNVHRILRFEHLQDDFNAVCSTIGIASQELPRRNRSEREGYRKYYDDETRALVTQRFRDEIEFFGYTFEHPDVP